MARNPSECSRGLCNYGTQPFCRDSGCSGIHSHQRRLLLYSYHKLHTLYTSAGIQGTSASRNFLALHYTEAACQTSDVQVLGHTTDTYTSSHLWDCSHLPDTSSRRAPVHAMMRYPRHLYRNVAQEVFYCMPCTQTLFFYYCRGCTFWLLRGMLLRPFVCGILHMCDKLGTVDVYFGRWHGGPVKKEIRLWPTSCRRHCTSSPLSC